MHSFIEDIDGTGWSSRLVHHGYVIGRTFGGDALIQASDGAVYMLPHDEWDDDFVDDMVEMDTHGAIDEAIGNWVADDFLTFYQILTSIRGARPTAGRR